jgi:hypothetical protein
MKAEKLLMQIRVRKADKRAQEQDSAIPASLRARKYDSLL